MRRLLMIVWCGLLAGASTHASTSDPFAYSFVMTPEEGPVDPTVEGRYSTAFRRCQGAAVTTDAIVACYSEEFARQDQVLNSVWRTAFARMSPASRSSLKTAQRRWVNQRDPFCKSKAAQFTGGTIAPVVYVDCRVEQTIRRTIWLSTLR